MRCKVQEGLHGTHEAQLWGERVREREEEEEEEESYSIKDLKGQGQLAVAAASWKMIRRNG